MKGLADLDLQNKRVLIRVDYNVPLSDTGVDDDTRIRATLPTLKRALENGAGIMLMSHLGRPSEGKFDNEFSLAPVAACLSALLEREVPLVDDWINGVDVKPGEVVMLENVRFQVGEKKILMSLHKAWPLCAIYMLTMRSPQRTGLRHRHMV